MTNFSGIGGPNFSGPNGVSKTNKKPPVQPGTVGSSSSGIYTGPSKDTVTFNGIDGNAGPNHNVNFSQISKMSLQDAKNQLHPTTFGGLNQLF